MYLGVSERLISWDQLDAIPARSTSAGRRKAKERPRVLGNLVSLPPLPLLHSSPRLGIQCGYCRTISGDGSTGSQ